MNRFAILTALVASLGAPAFAQSASDQVYDVTISVRSIDVEPLYENEALQTGDLTGAALSAAKSPTLSAAEIAALLATRG